MSAFITKNIFKTPKIRQNSEKCPFSVLLPIYKLFYRLKHLKLNIEINIFLKNNVYYIQKEHFMINIKCLKIIIFLGPIFRVRQML